MKIVNRKNCILVNISVMYALRFFHSLRFLLMLCLIIAMALYTKHPCTAQTSYAGDIYRWVDEKGGVHYSDTAPDSSSIKKQDVTHFKVDDGRSPAGEQKDEPQKGDDAPTRAASNEVTIYTTDTCPYCHQAKAFLSQKNISYREVNVRKDRAGFEEMVRITNQRGVPVIIIDGDVIVGFNRPVLEEKLR